jgi:hypothetical protein
MCVSNANPQLENGYIKIANEIWDEVIRRNFTKRQKDILQFIWRLSYGCRKKKAIIPMLKDFALCGVGPNHIKDELNYLVMCKVLIWHKDSNEYEIDKHYDQWQVSPVRHWDEERFQKLIYENVNSQNGKYSPSIDFPKQEVNVGYDDVGTSQNGKSETTGNFPKQEVDARKERGSLPKTGSENFPKQEVERVGLPETGSENFPKREVRMTENPSAAAAEVGSKNNNNIITIITPTTMRDSHVSNQDTNKDPYRVLQDAYCALHGKTEFDVSAIETMKMQAMIDKGIPVDFIIANMTHMFNKKKEREGDRFQLPGSFAYYDVATWNAWRKELLKRKAGEQHDAQDATGRGEDPAARTGQTSLTARFTKTS